MTDEADEMDETPDSTPEETGAGESAADESAGDTPDAQASAGPGADEAGEESDAAPSGGEETAAAEPAAAEPAAETTADDTTAGGETETADGGEDEDLEAAWAEALAETQGADTSPTVSASGQNLSDVSVPPAPAHPVEFPDLGVGRTGQGGGNIDLLMDVKLPVSIELGCTTQPISEILQWGQGSIVELDKLAGEPVNLLVNNKLVAKGEVVVVDENFGLRITSLIAGRDRDEHR